MRHVLITRFAIRWPEGHVRRKWEQRPGWVDYRLELLRKYTVPSVQAQTFKDFDWWFLIDPTFPGFGVDHFLELRKYGNLMLMDDPFEEQQQLFVGPLFSEVYKDEWVCSTRLDSDDIIRNDFMERVHAEASEEESFITFRHGYMLKGDKIAPRQFTRNPFVSYVEYADPFKSVFSVSHMKVHRQKYAPLKIIEQPPGWIQVDHSDNVKNLVSEKLPNFDSQVIDIIPIRENFTWRV